ncbi:hypothetical protein K488DRAFT_87626 [Vararia minispora EC-137]|uniref:Uncharacterized protein n=1 Tax=Vararia minispora EC-137 TaxID=1314806 RepID=A0ACB8QG62_9AGAM|nr:hypothetical protein K488DRAFT_87626 [Vararia minispora EC-137]
MQEFNDDPMGGLRYPSESDDDFKDEDIDDFDADDLSIRSYSPSRDPVPFTSATAAYDVSNPGPSTSHRRNFLQTSHKRDATTSFKRSAFEYRTPALHASALPSLEEHYASYIDSLPRHRLEYDPVMCTYNGTSDHFTVEDNSITIFTSDGSENKRPKRRQLTRRGADGTIRIPEWEPIGPGDHSYEHWDAGDDSEPKPDRTPAGAQPTADISPAIDDGATSTCHETSDGSASSSIFIYPVTKHSAFGDAVVGGYRREDGRLAAYGGRPASQYQPVNGKGNLG